MCLQIKLYVVSAVKVLETYINDLKASNNKLNDFDEGLFYALVDRVKVNKDSITIIWKDGLKVNGWSHFFVWKKIIKKYKFSMAKIFSLLYN